MHFDVSESTGSWFLLSRMPISSLIGVPICKYRTVPMWDFSLQHRGDTNLQFYSADPTSVLAMMTSSPLLTDNIQLSLTEPFYGDTVPLHVVALSADNDLFQPNQRRPKRPATVQDNSRIQSLCIAGRSAQKKTTINQCVRFDRITALSILYITFCIIVCLSSLQVVVLM